MDVDEQIVGKARFMGGTSEVPLNVLLANAGDENGTSHRDVHTSMQYRTWRLTYVDYETCAGLKVGYCLQRKRTYQIAVLEMVIVIGCGWSKLKLGTLRHFRFSS
ncbi:hypothetical protein GX48_02898 [Paracoccidioides brasiliensis]|nr:hypothetical protein GX48_02898 [Paracoccidioides brasiliensis]